MKIKYLITAASVSFAISIFFQNMTPLKNPQTGAEVLKCGPAPASINFRDKNFIFDSYIRSNWGIVSAKGFVCPKPPANIPSFDPPQFYIKNSNGECVRDSNGYCRINPKYYQHMKPWEDHADQINNLGDLYLSTRDQKVADCAMKWLVAWSSTKALSKTTNYGQNYSAFSESQGEYTRMGLPAGYLINYLKIKPSTPNTSDAVKFKVWMKSVLAASRAFMENREKNPADRNNHSYWAGYVNMLYAEAFDDMNSYEAKWGIKRFDMGVTSIKSNGILPNEMGRRELIAKYHQYAMVPLVLMAEMGQRNGLSMYNRGSGGLERLKNLIVGFYRNPAKFDQLVGAKQSESPQVFFESMPSYLSWMEIWYSRHKSPELKDLIARARYYTRKNDKGPIRRLGGDITLAFGVSDCHLPLKTANEIAIADILDADGGLLETEGHQGSGFFAIPNGGIYHSDGVNSYCQFATWNDFLAAGGNGDWSNSEIRETLPENMVKRGLCQVQ